ncbi:hypothetical protein EDD22DRAFT_845772 [Suillus occidentalis]|nr:hypothetical protein EDD22DRAFT_845772 [Suillus occidentalis]
MWNIGRYLGLKLFGSAYNNEALKVVYQLHAAAKNCKHFQQGNHIATIIIGIEHNLLVKLYNHEVDNLAHIVKDLVKEGGARVVKFAFGLLYADAQGFGSQWHSDSTDPWTHFDLPQMKGS